MSNSKARLGEPSWKGRDSGLNKVSHLTFRMGLDTFFGQPTNFTILNLGV